MGRKLSIRARQKARRRRRRILYASLAVAIIAIIVVVYLVAQSFNSPYTSYIGQPVSQTIFQGLAGFSNQTLAAVGSGSAQAPSAISGGTLVSNGKPEVLYIGAEYCPYCGVTRWSMMIALSKFGNFTGVDYMLSTASDVNPNTPTFTFANSSYSSNYISFVAVEHYDRSENVFQPLTTNESSLFSQYDASGGIPFIDFGNQYLVTGVKGGLSTLDLSGMNWTQVETQLDTPGSQTAQAIVGAANFFISTICAIDGQQPATVCSQSYATLPLSFAVNSQSIRQDLMSIPASSVDLKWTV